MINNYYNLEKVSQELKEKKLTIGVAESCTGGLLSAALTELPGSSLYFREGVVTYSVDSKNQRLNIDKKLIARYGVISPEIAYAMAESAKKFLGNDIGVGITGNAGPDVNQEDTPVGLVYIGISAKYLTKVYPFNFNGKRNEIRRKAVQEAINIIKEVLEEF